MSEDDLKPGEIKISRLNPSGMMGQSQPLLYLQAHHEGSFPAGVCLTVILWLLGTGVLCWMLFGPTPVPASVLRDSRSSPPYSGPLDALGQSRSSTPYSAPPDALPAFGSTASGTGQCYDKNWTGTCVTGPPVRPDKFVAIIPRFAEDNLEPRAYVISARHVSIRIVDTIPVELGDQYLSVVPGVSRGPAFRAGVKRGMALVIQGDVTIRVGPLVDRDAMASLLGVEDSRVRTVEILYDGTPRGPPSSEVISGDDLLPLVVYVVGSIHHYHGPKQFGSSIHTIGVIDVPLRASFMERLAWERALASWWLDLAKTTGVPVTAFRGATTEAQARKIIAEQRSDVIERRRFDEMQRHPQGIPTWRDPSDISSRLPERRYEPPRYEVRPVF